MKESIPRIALIAGEPSGDVLGARLIEALKQMTGGAVQVEGIGGEQMTKAGLASRIPLSELGHMGIFELLPHLPNLLRRIGETADWLRKSPPDLLVTIDSPGFTMRVIDRLRGSGIPILHYVAPAVWAWGASRAAKIARHCDHLLVLLPFEPAYFTRHGLACTYVGHPALETMAGVPDKSGFRRRHGIPPDVPLLCVLPGSRAGEIRRLMPGFQEAVRRIAGRHPGLQVVLPTVDTVAARVRAGAGKFGVPVIVIDDPAQKRDAFAASSAALAASGTVAVELAVTGTPAVIAYRGNPITAVLARYLIKVKFASVINLMLDRPAQPELLQERCRPELMATEIDRLLTDPAARAAQISAYGEALAKLAVQGRPSERAAAVALSMLVGGS